MVEALIACVLILPAFTGVGLAIYHMKKENVPKQARKKKGRKTWKNG